MSDSKAGRPVMWGEEQRKAIADLLRRYIADDPLFENITFHDVANVVPTVAHFLVQLYEKWSEAQEQYPALKGISGPPCKQTYYTMEEPKPYHDIMMLMQERGLVYGSMTNSIGGTIIGVMLQNHGYIRKDQHEHSGGIVVNFDPAVKGTE